MTIREYILSKFKSYSIELSDADLLDMCISLNDKDEVTSDNLFSIKRAICKFLPDLLARPASISEGGMSVSWDKAGLEAYYDILCKDTGIANTQKQRVTFLHY